VDQILVTGYATALAGDPARIYRQIDMAGRTTNADGAGLVQFLYEELVSALRAAAFAVERGHHARRSERVTRATAILFALEAGLDHDHGGDVARALASLYAGARRTIVQASIGADPRPFRDAADNMEEIAQAWATVRAA
jgi:flagellar protein FliS